MKSKPKCPVCHCLLSDAGKCLRCRTKPPPPADALHCATVETRHFTFEGFGATEAGATAALTTALREHSKLYGCDPGWVRDLLRPEAGNVGLRTIVAGQGYRDRQPLGRRK